MERQYRVVDVKRYDRRGKLTDADEPAPASEWRPVEPGSMMDKYFVPGCEVLYEKRRNP